MKICFVTDGGRQIGMGHIQQSTTVARALPAGADVCFLTKSDDTVLTAIRDSGFHATRLPSDADILQHLTILNPDVIVFDKIDVAEQLAKDIKQTLDAGLVIFTNLTRANRHADVAVTLNRPATVAPEGRFSNLSYTDLETHTHYFYGPRYAALRPEFLEYQPEAKSRGGHLEQLLLIFGGSDPSNLTTAVLDELLDVDQSLRIDVVLGAHFGDDDSLSHVLGQRRATCTAVSLRRNVHNVAELMRRADLVITSPGLSLLEALCVGTPAIVIPQNDLQRDTYGGFIQMVERNEVHALGGMIERREFIYADEEHIVLMQIGQGMQELVDAILFLGDVHRNQRENLFHH